MPLPLILDTNIIIFYIFRVTEGTLGRILAPIYKPEWPEVQTFEPTMAEFSNLMNLLLYMEKQGAHKAGIAKIRPPVEWVARARGYQPCDIDLEIPSPIQQTIAPTQVPGAFQANHSNLPKLKVEDYRSVNFF